MLTQDQKARKVKRAEADLEAAEKRVLKARQQLTAAESQLSAVQRSLTWIRDAPVDGVDLTTVPARVEAGEDPDPGPIPGGWAHGRDGSEIP